MEPRNIRVALAPTQTLTEEANFSAIWISPLVSFRAPVHSPSARVVRAYTCVHGVVLAVVARPPRSYAPPPADAHRAQARRHRRRVRRAQKSTTTQPRSTRNGDAHADVATVHRRGAANKRCYVSSPSRNVPFHVHHGRWCGNDAKMRLRLPTGGTRQ